MCSCDQRAIAGRELEITNVTLVLVPIALAIELE